jgi:hypothetical protein
VRREVNSDSKQQISLVSTGVSTEGYKDYLYEGILSVSVEERALELRRMYGTCKASYILREVYKLPYKVIAKIFGISISAVATCVYRIRLKKQTEVLLSIPAGSPGPDDFKEVCRGSALSLECQMLEAEAFMFNVAREALPASAFWDVFIYAKAAHRIVFPDIYSYIVELADASMSKDADLRKLHKLFRAVNVKGRWYVGDGIVAYTFNLLDKSCFYRGYSNPRLTFNILAAIERLARKNPTREPLVYLAMVISDRLNYLINAKRTEILQTMKEVYATLTRMYDLD